MIPGNRLGTVRSKEQQAAPNTQNWKERKRLSSARLDLLLPCLLYQR